MATLSGAGPQCAASAWALRPLQFGAAQSSLERARGLGAAVAAALVAVGGVAALEHLLRAGVLQCPVQAMAVHWGVPCGAGQGAGCARPRPVHRRAIRRGFVGCWRVRVACACGCRRVDPPQPSAKKRRKYSAPKPPTKFFLHVRCWNCCSFSATIVLCNPLRVWGGGREPSRHFGGGGVKGGSVCARVTPRPARKQQWPCPNNARSCVRNVSELHRS